MSWTRVRAELGEKPAAGYCTGHCEPGQGSPKAWLRVFSLLTEHEGGVEKASQSKPNENSIPVAVFLLDAIGAGRRQAVGWNSRAAATLDRDDDDLGSENE